MKLVSSGYNPPSGDVCVSFRGDALCDGFGAARLRGSGARETVAVSVSGMQIGCRPPPSPRFRSPIER